MANTIGPKIAVVDSIPDGATYGDDGRAFLRMFQALIQPNVINMTTSAAPGSPSNGDMYVVASIGSGAWVGKTNFVAYWSTDNPSAPSGEWEFYQPLAGWIVVNRADNLQYLYNGSTWAAIGGGGGSGAIIYGTDSSPQVLAPQFLQVGVATLSGGTKTLTILPAIFTGSYFWSIVATSHTTNAVRISSDFGATNTCTVSGTGTDSFSYIIFPIFAGS